VLQQLGREFDDVSPELVIAAALQQVAQSVHTPSQSTQVQAQSSHWQPPPQAQAVTELS
jgi:hypothetical protein